MHGTARLHGLENELQFTTPAGAGLRTSHCRACTTRAMRWPRSPRRSRPAFRWRPSIAVSRAFRGVKGRLQRWRAGLNGAVVLDDTYNANPDSMRAGIDVLAATIGRKVLVLGDMGEIGEAAGQYHDEIGGYAKSAGVDVLFRTRRCQRDRRPQLRCRGSHFRKIDELIEALRPELAAGTTVLVKGRASCAWHGAEMRVADAICGLAAKENN